MNLIKIYLNAFLVAQISTRPNGMGFANNVLVIRDKIRLPTNNIIAKILYNVYLMNAKLLMK